jgi:hypothetical protein
MRNSRSGVRRSYFRNNRPGSTRAACLAGCHGASIAATMTTAVMTK